MQVLDFYAWSLLQYWIKHQLATDTQALMDDFRNWYLDQVDDKMLKFVELQTTLRWISSVLLGLTRPTDEHWRQSALDVYVEWMSSQHTPFQLRLDVWMLHTDYAMEAMQLSQKIAVAQEQQRNHVLCADGRVDFDLLAACTQSNSRVVLSHDLDALDMSQMHPAALAALASTPFMRLEEVPRSPCYHELVIYTDGSAKRSSEDDDETVAASWGLLVLIKLWDQSQLSPQWLCLGYCGGSALQQH